MAKKIESKEIAPVAVASQLTSTAMAELANYDKEIFKDGGWFYQ